MKGETHLQLESVGPAEDPPAAVAPPERIELDALLDIDDLIRFAQSVADLTQVACAVVKFDSAAPRPVAEGAPMQFVRAPICRVLAEAGESGRRSCLFDTHAAAHRAMKKGEPVTCDCVGGEQLLFAAPILLTHEGVVYPKAAIVAGQDSFRFHFANRLARSLGMPVPEVEDLLCQTDRRCLDAAQLRRLRSIIAVQAQSFSRQISDRYAELQSIQTILQQRRELEDAYAQLDDEFHMVGEIQRHLTPKEEPSLPGFAIASHYEPALHAGGDYYDFFAHEDGSWGALIADVSGHGPAAAVVMAMMRALLHAQHLPPEPGKVLEYLNRQLKGQIMSYQFVTAFLIRLSPDSDEVRFASAGHHPPLLYRRRTRCLETVRMPANLPLGIEDQPIEAGTLSFEPGDALMMYTDGLPDARNAQAELLKTDPLREAFAAAGAAGADAAATRDAVMKAVRSFVGDQPPYDDQTLVIVQKL